MKRIYILTLFLLKINISTGQSCFSNGLTFINQSEVDNFILNNPECTTIEGDLNIFSTSLLNLDSLINITTIEGNLFVNQANSLISTKGLNNLISIGGDLVLLANENIETIDGLESLESVGGTILIRENDKLRSITSLGNLNKVGQDILIQQNPQIDSINLQNIGNSLRSITIEDNQSLVSIICGNEVDRLSGKIKIYLNRNLREFTGFIQTTAIDDEIFIQSNDSLRVFEGFDSLQILNNRLFMVNNDVLESIPSFNNLESLGSLYLSLDKLRLINGFNNVSGTMRSIEIIRCDSLQLIEGFINLDTISALRVIESTSLHTIKGFSKVQSIKKEFFFDLLRNLESVDAFENIESIDSIINFGGLENMDNVDFLSNLTKVNGVIFTRRTVDNIPNGFNDISGLANIDYQILDTLVIEYCPNLSICEHKPICDYLEQPKAKYRIGNNAAGCDSKEEILTACMMVSTYDESFVNELIIYPNPSTGILYIESKEKLPLFNYDIYDIIGKSVRSGKLVDNQIDASNIENGMYIVSLRTGDRIYIQKVTIANNR